MKKTTIKKSLLYNSIGTFTYLFLQWLTTFVVVWISGYETAGIFSIAMSISSIFFAISNFGMRGYQASDLKKEYSEKEYIFSRIITCLISLILTIVYAILQGYDGFVILCVCSYMIYKLSESFIDVLHGSMQKKWLYNKIGLSFLIRGIISIISFAITLKVTNNLLVSIVIMAILTYICMYFLDIKNYKRNIEISDKFNKSKLIKLFIVCLPLALYSFFTTYLVSFPRLEIEKLLGEKMLGIYTTYANPAVIIQVAASFIFSPLVTLFAQLKNDNNIKEYAKLILKCFVATLSIGIVGYVFCYFFGDFFIKLLFGKDILIYNYLLCQIIIVSTFTAITWLFASILTVMRNLKLLLLGSVVGFGISCLFADKFIDVYGLSGVNYLLIIIYIIITAFYAIIITTNLKNMRNNKDNK